jgi:uncharacterized protein (TIGR03118 family)
MFKISARKILRAVSAMVCGVFVVSATAFAQTYVQTNLVSDVPGRAATTDRLLVNPWGISRLPGGPWWVSDNETGVTTIYKGSGVPAQNPPGTQFVVTIPAPGGGTSAPTGQVANSISSDFSGALFVFVTEDGTISAFIPSVDPLNAVLKINHPGANYKGVTISTFNNANYLYAADFHNGVIEVYDNNFIPHVFSPTAFTDPDLPEGYGPFNVQAVGNAVVVAYAKQDEDAEDEVAGPGLGYVDVYSPNGVLQMRLQHGPWLNAPWGVALAPPNFGELSNMLLVGNFGSGLIAAFDPSTGDFVSFLQHTKGAPIKINGLWGIEFGNGANAGPANALFFAAGVANEHHGLFGRITPE